MSATQNHLKMLDRIKAAVDHVFLGGGEKWPLRIVLALSLLVIGAAIWGTIRRAEYYYTKAALEEAATQRGQVRAELTNSHRVSRVVIKDGLVIQWNVGMGDLLGWKADERIGKPFTEIDDVQDPSWGTFLGRRLKRKDGSTVDVEVVRFDYGKGTTELSFVPTDDAEAAK